MGPRPPESDFQIIFELSLENFDHGGNDAELERLLEHDININRLQSENEYSAKGKFSVCVCVCTSTIFSVSQGHPARM